MRILIFSNVFYPSIGGIENQTLLLVKEFLQRGHVVKVITEQKQKDFLPGIQVFHKPGFLTSLNLYFWCQVFYMPNVSLKGIWLLFFNPYKKWIISHNDFHLIDEMNLLNSIKRFFTKFASVNIVVSASISKRMSVRTTVVHNCYDDALFKIYSNVKRIYDFVFLGRLVSQKGCDLLIRACRDLQTDFTLNIIGDGDEKNKLQELVNSYNLDNCIKFLGFLQGEHLARMLNRHKIMVIPSLSAEGFGIVALEGMACGCNVVASNAGGLPEAVNKFGEIFEMGNQEQLTEHLKKALKRGHLEPSNDLKEYLNNLTKSTVACRYLELFNS